MYIHQTLCQNVELNGFDGRRPRVGAAICYKSDAGRKSLIEDRVLLYDVTIRFSQVRHKPDARHLERVSTSPSTTLAPPKFTPLLLLLLLPLLYVVRRD